VEAGQIQFKLRKDPFRAGPNFDKFDPSLRPFVNNYIAGIRKNFAKFQENGYSVPGKADLKGPLATNYREYCSHFNLDILSLFDHLSKEIPAKEKPALLDVACGFAVAAREMAIKLGDRARVFGLDAFKYTQINARMDLPPIEVIEGIMESFPFAEENLFHLITLHYSLSYSMVPYATLDEAMRVLVPRGVALVELDLTKDPNEKRTFAFYGALITTLLRVANNKRFDHPDVDQLNFAELPDFTSLAFSIKKPERLSKRFSFSDLAQKSHFPQFMTWSLLPDGR